MREKSFNECQYTHVALLAFTGVSPLPFELVSLFVFSKALLEFERLAVIERDYKSSRKIDEGSEQAFSQYAYFLKKINKSLKRQALHWLACEPGAIQYFPRGKMIKGIRSYIFFLKKNAC